jgi:methylase of polypeptide subunit release factors
MIHEHDEEPTRDENKKSDKMTKDKMRNNKKSITMMMSSFFLLIVFLSSVCESLSSSSEQASRHTDPYAKARHVRTIEGHDAALSYYQQILRDNPQDASAAVFVAACRDTPHRHDHVLNDSLLQREKRLLLADWLHQRDYHPGSIAQLVLNGNISKLNGCCCAPLYLTPLMAGSPAPPSPNSALACLIQLFLLAVCVPRQVCLQFFDEDDLQLWHDVGVAFGDDTKQWIVPYVHIMPVDLASLLLPSSSSSREEGIDTKQKRTLLVATDLHPRVVSMTTVGSRNDGTVMYIGPDSIALIQHYDDYPLDAVDGVVHIVDLGTGSGIQALVAAARIAANKSTTTTTTTTTPTPVRVTCVDINPRALEFALWNFQWNRMHEPERILGDLRLETGKRLPLRDGDDDDSVQQPQTKLPWNELLGRPTLIVANPPFLPVPPDDKVIRQRHGFFSSGGASGDILLQRILELAGQTLGSSSSSSSSQHNSLQANQTCHLAIVSEFMNPGERLVEKLQAWWGRKLTATTTFARGILYTNQEALSASVYASRRADSQQEQDIWNRHLNDEEITEISPGLLFIEIVKDEQQAHKKGVSLNLSNVLVPKTMQGSIWTPTNRNALEFTKETNHIVFGW